MEQYQLVYCLSEKALSDLPKQVMFVDEKLAFEKELNTVSSGAILNISTFEGDWDPKLEKLSFQSGAFSRFKLDPRLTNFEFEKLYKTWIEQAFQNRETLTTPDLEGMVTVSVDAQSAKIGLIAVDHSSRGQGLGKKLVEAGEVYAEQKGANRMSISTQSANTVACKLYTSLGYQVQSRMYIYHYWNKDFK